MQLLLGNSRVVLRCPRRAATLLVQADRLLKFVVFPAVVYFEPVHYLDNSGDSGSQRAGQLLLMKRGNFAAQNDGVSNHLDFDRLQSRGPAMIDGKPHPLGQVFGIGELLNDGTITRADTSLFPSNGLLSIKKSRRDRTPEGLPTRRLTR